MRFIQMLLVLLFSFSLREVWGSCEADRANVIKLAIQDCGTSYCNGSGWCVQYHGITFQRVKGGYELICSYTVSQDGDPLSTWTGHYATVPDCDGAPPPPSSPSGPSGSGAGSGGSGGPPCRGQCCSPKSSGGSGAPGSAVRGGSIVGMEAQTLGEVIPVVGTNFSMYYYSGYQAGRSVDFKIQYGISGAIPRDYLTGFGIVLNRSSTTLDTATYGNTLSNQTYTYTWNGLDSSNTFAVDSARFSLIVNETSPTGTFPISIDYVLSHWDASKIGLGGWLPTNIYHYDVLAKRLYTAMEIIETLKLLPMGLRNSIWHLKMVVKFIYSMQMGTICIQKPGFLGRQF